MRVPAGMSVCFRDCARCVCFRVTSLLFARYSGSVEDGDRIRQKTMLRYTWQLVVGQLSLSAEVHLLCRDAARRGVRPPKHWKHELMAVSAIHLNAASEDQRPSGANPSVAAKGFGSPFPLEGLFAIDCRAIDQQALQT